MIKLEINTDVKKKTLYFNTRAELLFFVSDNVEEFTIKRLHDRLFYLNAGNKKEDFLINFHEDKGDFTLSANTLEEILKEKAYRDIDISLILNAEPTIEAKRFLNFELPRLLRNVMSKIPY